MCIPQSKQKFCDKIYDFYLTEYVVVYESQIGHQYGTHYRTHSKALETIIYQSFQQLTSSLFSQEICSLQNHCQTQTKLTSQNLFSRSTPMGSCVTVFRDAIITQWTKIENSIWKLYGGKLDLLSILYCLQMLELCMNHVFRYLNQ